MAKRRGHGEGSIYQRASDGRWMGTVDLGWVDGKRKRKYVSGHTYKAVRAEIARLTAQRDQGLIVSTERLTVAQFLERWLADVVEGRASPRTHETYARIVRLHIAPVIGKKQLGKLSVIDVNTLLRDRERAKLSPRMVRQVLVVLRMALKQAVRWDLVPRNVATLTDAAPGRPFEAMALDAEQIAAFLTALADNRLEALFAIAIMTGPRVGELQGLQWRDADLDKGELRIRQALVRVGGEYSFAEPKTAKSKRTIALPARCVDALRAHRKAQLRERLVAGGRWQDNDLVFCSTIGTPIDEWSLRREFRAVLEKADLPRIRFHDLRHTAITDMVQRGIPPHVVAAIVGHSTLTMTLSVYAKVVGSTLTNAAAVMDAAYRVSDDADKASS